METKKPMQENYQRRLDQVLDNITRESTKANTPKRLLLHSCCAPCSSYVLEYLASYFEITVFYYNPNIYPPEEYEKRVAEQQRLILKMQEKEDFVQKKSYPIHFLEGRYEPQRFFEVTKGFEEEPEGGKRCEKCFRLRLFEAARVAKEGGYDFFTTTLSISPLKNARLLNEIGQDLFESLGIPFLPSDFKKKGGYQRSIELSKEYELYRQNFCGCIYSVRKETIE